MSVKKRNNLRVLEGYKESPRKRIAYFIRKFNIRKILMITAAVILLAVIFFLFINLQTYTTVKVTNTYSITGAADNGYKEFAKGVLKYSRDGVSYLNMDGEEQWNFPYQIKTPFVEANEKAAAIADKGGNHIKIFDKDGLKGEIETSLPIEKIAVSEQGIVCAILKNESAPRVICYDNQGNILVEHKITLSGMGYPMDVALSGDGETLQVSYLHVQEGVLRSKVVFYNFGEEGQSGKDYQIGSREYEDTVIATGFYMEKNVFAAVGDNCISIFKGKDSIEEEALISFEEKIQSIGYNNKYIAVILRNSGDTGYELRVYNKSGKVVTSESFGGDYRNVKIAGSQIILYDGKECAIFTKSGMQKFDGEMGNSILEIIPAAGANKYVIMNANGMETVRLAK